MIKRIEVDRLLERLFRFGVLARVCQRVSQRVIGIRIAGVQINRALAILLGLFKVALEKVIGRSFDRSLWVFGIEFGGLLRRGEYLFECLVRIFAGELQ